jgi:hypothetical protein
VSGGSRASSGAAVPAKGWLWLHAGVVKPEVAATFMAIIAKEHASASPQDRISKAVFLVQEGEVVGLARADGVPAPEEPPKKGFWARLFGR